MAARKTKPEGKKPDKLWHHAIMRAAKRPMGQDVPKTAPKLEHLADSLFKKGIDGDVQAAREIGDRLDGKAPQAITGPDGGAMAIFVIENGPKG